MARTKRDLRADVFNRPWLYAEGMPSAASYYAGPWSQHTFCDAAVANRENAEWRWRGLRWGCAVVWSVPLVQQDPVFREYAWFH